ncbi:MAG: hypothetical protein LBS16_00260 [Prevotellaceae bacterium]|jgi:hypothetical protein|nr:hypothetical protein [Prevotellaceae bacterium]
MSGFVARLFATVLWHFGAKATAFSANCFSHIWGKALATATQNLRLLFVAGK